VCNVPESFSALSLKIPSPSIAWVGWGSAVRTPFLFLDHLLSLPSDVFPMDARRFPAGKNVLDPPLEIFDLPPFFFRRRTPFQTEKLFLSSRLSLFIDTSGFLFFFVPVEN